MPTYDLYDDYLQDHAEEGAGHQRLLSILDAMITLYVGGGVGSARYRELWRELNHIDPDNAQAWLDEARLPMPG